MPLGINREKAFSVEAAVGQRRADSNAERPAPGYRTTTTASAWSIGNEGSVRSASANGIASVYLRFAVNAVQPCFADCRAYGFPLRCLSE
ncbi:hypothetical protein [uncultured Rikenella sp.]|uniref:hypothetical protein n=1 Tax=uncultured Rikenella sp. TaxID=368003 RepID=UPI0026085B2C|nr:hypothetical protein [uncultured Rikenella sp.]